MQLPLEKYKEEICTHVRDHSRVIIDAPPGTGKTTLVPRFLIEEKVCQHCIMLEPRRIAARAAALRIAEMRGEKVGECVGYRTRHDSRASSHTRIEIVTEGILTRMIQDDPELHGIDAVIFDEFHERNVHADLALALLRDVQENIRQDMRIIIMSATVHGEKLSAFLDECPIIRVPGSLFPVDTHYVFTDGRKRIEERTAAVIAQAVCEEKGSILTFLPGAGEIKKVHDILRDNIDSESIDIVPLYGALSRDMQDRAIAPAPQGKRKIVLATNIAETSITIEGIRIVIDCGLQRTGVYDSGTGMSQLITRPASQASADQCRGRAGRTGPGICYRLWDESSHASRRAYDTPEINEADMAPLALELACWGVKEPGELKWQDPPPEQTYNTACDLLYQLHALSADGIVTAHGRQMAALGAHPRLAHMMLTAKDAHKGSTACVCAALLSERDIFSSRDAGQTPDIRVRIDWLNSSRRGAHLRHVRAAAHTWQKKLKIPHTSASPDECGDVLAWAYPDRIAQKRGDTENTYILANGRGAAFRDTCSLSRNDYIVAAHLDAAGRNARIYLAAPYSLEQLNKQYEDICIEKQCIEWDEKNKNVRAVNLVMYHSLVIEERPLQSVDPEDITAVLCDAIRNEGIRCLPWTRDTREWQARVCFLREIYKEMAHWPDVSDDTLMSTLENWLAPFLVSMRSLDDLKKVDVLSALKTHLTWEQTKQLEKEAPTHLAVPSGSRIRLDYCTRSPPVLPVRIQEMFGCTETPRVAGGRAPVTVHFLSPAHRPVQVTQDVANFWLETYAHVKKELKGRYPKHYWPENPLQATATRKTKKNM